MVLHKLIQLQTKLNLLKDYFSDPNGVSSTRHPVWPNDIGKGDLTDKVGGSIFYMTDESLGMTTIDSAVTLRTALGSEGLHVNLVMGDGKKKFFNLQEMNDNCKEVILGRLHVNGKNNRLLPLMQRGGVEMVM